MNTMQLDCFMEVAETLSFARAAEHLNVTQPAVTQQIHSLEKELNTRLFKRTTRTVELTQAGIIFMNDAKDILTISNRAKMRFKTTCNDDRHFFSIGCYIDSELYPFSDVLRKMSDCYPNLYPTFQVVPYQHLFQLLMEESVDVIVTFQQEIPPKKDITYKKLAEIPAVGIMVSDHPLAKKLQLSASDLANEKLILNDPQKCPNSLRKIQYQLMEYRPASDLYFYDSIDVSAMLAKAGYGIAILPDLSILKDRTLTRVPLSGFEPMSFGAYYKVQNENPILKLFLRLAQEHIGQ